LNAKRGCDWFVILSEFPIHYLGASEQEYVLELFVNIVFGGKSIIGIALYGIG
jgi:hypothetical protein